MAYNGAKISDYSRINPVSGTGFILTRLAKVLNSGMTRKEVYEGTRYKHYTPGYHSSIWAKLLEDELIRSDGGFMLVKHSISPWNRYSNGRCYRAKSLWKGTAPTYFITEKGMKVFVEMMCRHLPAYVIGGNTFIDLCNLD